MVLNGICDGIVPSYSLKLKLRLPPSLNPLVLDLLLDLLPKYLLLVLLLQSSILLQLQLPVSIFFQFLDLSIMQFCCLLLLLLIQHHLLLQGVFVVFVFLLSLLLIVVLGTKERLSSVQAPVNESLYLFATLFVKIGEIGFAFRTAISAIRVDSECIESWLEISERRVGTAVVELRLWRLIKAVLLLLLLFLLVLDGFFEFVMVDCFEGVAVVEAGVLGDLDGLDESGIKFLTQHLAVVLADGVVDSIELGDFLHEYGRMEELQLFSRSATSPSQANPYLFNQCRI